MAAESADQRTSGWFSGAFDPAANLRTMLDPRGAGRRIVEDFADEFLARVDGRRCQDGAGTPTNENLNQVLRELRAVPVALGLQQREQAEEAG